MEKYGTDLTHVPVSDDQLRTIRDLSKQKNIPENQVKVPATFKEANEIIDHIAKYGNE